MLHGDPLAHGRASAVHGDLHAQARALNGHGDLFGRDRAPFEHGGHYDHGRAFALHGDLPGHARAVQDGTCAERPWGLHQSGSGRFNDLPRPGLGGGGAGDGMNPGRAYGPWNEGSGSMQFGDWLHLITPIMKDISSSAGWWWESTLREAKGYYEEWRKSSPLQRIQLQPRLPDDLREAQFQRTEQRGIQMLLKAIPAAEQQALVTDRVLTSTAIIYKLLVRFQPGGPGEKQILLQQLTSVPKSKTIQDVAAAVRNWRRHFGRAQEAAFRLSQSRMELQLDQQPTQQSLWAFSQCLLAEAETLALFQSTSTTSPENAPLKLKQLQGDPKTPLKSAPADGRSKMSPTAEKPCKYFISESGCKAGKSCKWLHSWDGVEDKASRCWICGGKDHRKADCKVKGSGKKPGEPSSGSGGGNGRGTGPTSSSPSTLLSSSSVGGKAGAAATKVLNAASDDNGSLMNDGKGHGSVSALEKLEVGSSSTTAMADEGNGGGGSGGDASNAKSDKTAELLHEATQLLKSLKIQSPNPKLKVMQLGDVDPVRDDMVLLDSGATHSLDLHVILMSGRKRSALWSNLQMGPPNPSV
eukprot:s2125_g6.t1